ncbi:DinB family protein [Cyclobacterium xiamenense]|uniref:DinB family protein n=1 Tax=Cyclobacterium xiamenense TaxID=1297121 RepID=UPI0035CF35D5
MQSELLIDEMLAQSRAFLRAVEGLKQLDWDALTWKESPASWNILECVEHLNLYGDFYLPQMERKINGSIGKPDPTFKSGLLGNYFAQSMVPKEKLNKMKTFADKNPIHAELDLGVIQRCIDQQKVWMRLLEQARGVSLNRVKIPTSFSRLIQLKLGDAFRFFINHQLRHLAQIERIRAARQQA